MINQKISISQFSLTNQPEFLEDSGVSGDSNDSTGEDRNSDLLDEEKRVVLEPLNGEEQVVLEPLEVFPGDVIVDADGDWVTLQTGVNYRPSGCTSESCEMTFEDQESAMMDLLVAEFRLKLGDPMAH